MASFFAEDGSLAVNGQEPAVGQPAIADIARGFYEAFPANQSREANADTTVEGGMIDVAHEADPAQRCGTQRGQSVRSWHELCRPSGHRWRVPTGTDRG